MFEMYSYCNYVLAWLKFFPKEAANQISLEKDSPKVSQHIKKEWIHMKRNECRWILSSKPAKLPNITLPVKFFKNPTYNIAMYLVHYQQFNLVGCFCHKLFRTFHHKCSNTLMLSISHMKLFKRTKKLEFNLHIEFRRAVLSTTFVNRRNLWKHSSNPCSKRPDKNHPIPSRLKKSPYAGQKLSRSPFYPVPLLI